MLLVGSIQDVQSDSGFRVIVVYVSLERHCGSYVYSKDYGVGVVGCENVVKCNMRFSVMWCC